MEEAERLCDRVAIIDHGRIVDVGAPAELVRRHCPERTVVLATDDPQAAVRLSAMPEVMSMTREGSHVTIHGRTADLVTQVIGCVAEHRMYVSDFRTEVPTLEDVFIKLTGHTIRD
jgi:ABC-2 type transport system ATP-binding protein